MRPCPLHSCSRSHQTSLPKGKFKDKNLTDPTMVTVRLYESSAGPFCAQSPVPPAQPTTNLCPGRASSICGGCLEA